MARKPIPGDHREVRSPGNAGGGHRRTVRTVNLVSGQSATMHYSKDGKRSLAGLSDRPLVTPYEIRDGRHIETTILGDQLSIALFSVDGRILGAREDEAGFVNWEVIPQ
jgi:hypothetical protein